MMLKNPEQFRMVAREWAVKFAGATRREGGEGSGGATAESIKAKKIEAKKAEGLNKVAQ